MSFTKGKLTKPYSSKGTKKKKGGLFISQDKYVGEILKKFRFTEVKTASTQMETQKPLLKDEDGEEVDVHMYRSMIDSLMYLTSSRPDIMFAVCVCARYQVNPKVSHLHVVKRIFRYLKGQVKLSLWYPKDSSFDLVAYIDSDYSGASLDRKSTTGDCQFLECRLISWQCKKQTVGGKKLEKKNRSRSHKLKRLYKVGLTARVESSDNEASLGEDASKHGRIDAIDADEKLPSLMEIKSTKPKEKGVVIQELGESTTIKSSQLPSQQSQDKGKGILIEPVKLINKKDLIRLDEEVALKLQAEFDEEERLAREKAEKEKKANIALD
ncbi:hypothetical protein Tco_0896351 [Tanacetum coccineum]